MYPLIRLTEPSVVGGADAHGIVVVAGEGDNMAPLHNAQQASAG